MPTQNARVRPRPIRVAYLVEESEYWSTILDEITAEAYGRWGGRFTLVAPCVAGEVVPTYLGWLKRFDADIIYSYVDLSEEVQTRLHEFLSPAFLVRHEGYREPGEYRAFRPELPMQGLTVLSVCGWLARGSTIYAASPVKIADVYTSVEPSRFLQDNFGCYGQSMTSWPIAANMADHLQATIFVPPEIQSDKRMMPRPEAGSVVVDTENALIDRLAMRGSLFGLAQLSAKFAPQHELPHSDWSRTVAFVVGDTFADRLTFWNAGLHVPAWLQGGVTTLRATVEDFADETRFKSITEILKNRVHHPVGGSASHSQIMLRSASVPEKELMGLAERLLQAKTHQVYTHKTIGSLDEVVPKAVRPPNVERFVDPTISFGPADWQAVDIIEGRFRPPTILPRHIRDLPLLPGVAKDGLWAQDCLIERPENHSKYDNVQHSWILSQSLRMTPAFSRGYQLSGLTSPLCMPRTTAEGLVAMFADQRTVLPDVRAPNDQTAFRQALVGRRDWWPFTKSSRADLPAGIAIDARPSDKGRYVTALLRMAGGIHGAASLFLSEFWSKQFEALGATPKVNEARIDQVERTLRKRLPGGSLDDDDAWKRLAKVVLSQARAERSPKRFLRYDDLAAAFDAFRIAVSARDGRQPADPTTDEHERASLDHSLTYLCQQEILHQGHEWKCQQCYNNNWVAIADLAKSMSCEVCGRFQPAPVNDPWQFKPNAFVLEALREHGALPMIWCISRLAADARRSFYFLAGHELFLSEESADAGRPDAEIDVLAVCDGEVQLCEVKSSAYDIDIEKLVLLALRIRPQQLLLAVMAPASPAIKVKLEQLRERLAATSIAVNSLTLEENDFDASTWLHYQ